MVINKKEITQCLSNVVALPQTCFTFDVVSMSHITIGDLKSRHCRLLQKSKRDKGINRLRIVLFDGELITIVQKGLHNPPALTRSSRVNSYRVSGNSLIEVSEAVLYNPQDVIEITDDNIALLEDVAGLFIEHYIGKYNLVIPPTLDAHLMITIRNTWPVFRSDSNKPLAYYHYKAVGDCKLLTYGEYLKLDETDATLITITPRQMVIKTTDIEKISSELQVLETDLFFTHRINTTREDNGYVQHRILPKMDVGYILNKAKR